MKVIIIGAGLGGLACAITCRQEGIDVLVVERAPKILAVSLLPGLRYTLLNWW
jgi:salicylate hydroxylase